MRSVDCRGDGVPGRGVSEDVGPAKRRLSSTAVFHCSYHAAADELAAAEGVVVPVGDRDGRSATAAQGHPVAEGARAFHSCTADGHVHFGELLAQDLKVGAQTTEEGEGM